MIQKFVWFGRTICPRKRDAKFRLVQLILILMASGIETVVLTLNNLSLEVCILSGVFTFLALMATLSLLVAYCAAETRS